MGMKKIICSAAVVALMSLVMTSCNKQAPKVEEKSTTTTTANAGMKIAYIEVDSIMSQYKFCKEYSLILEKKSQNIQNTINAKGRSLQTAAAKFQQDIQNNKYTQQQAEAVQAGLQKTKMLTCRLCSRDWVQNSRLKQRNSTKLCVTAYSTIWLFTIRTRNSLLF